ncbi:serine protease [bacterium]|nr:serine protease [bacterium]
MIERFAKTPLLTCILLACALSLGRAQDTPEKKDPPAPGAHKVSLEDFENAFLDVADKVRPGVVAIEVRHEGEEDEDQGPSRAICFSGVVWDAEGTVVALGRELESATEISLSPFEGEPLKARFAGVDDETGIAVLKVEGERKGLAVLEHGSSDKLRAGSFCITVGNPIGLRHSVSFGHIAATGRTVKRGSLEMRNVIQVALPVNPGDPGGLLADSRGRFVGVLASSLRRTDPALERDFGRILKHFTPKPRKNGEPPMGPFGGLENLSEILPQIQRVLQNGSPFAQNISVAIPVEEVANAVERVKKNQGKPWLGVDVRDVEGLDETFREGFGIEGEKGVVILGVRPGSPASKGKLKAGDVVLSWDGTDVKGMENLKQLVQATKLGANVKLEVQRKDKKVELVLTIEGRGASDSAPDRRKQP